jgi:GTP cyclohydrolase I
MKQVIDFGRLNSLAKNAGERIFDHFKDQFPQLNSLRVYPVPRGGIPAVLAVMASSAIPLVLVDCPQKADFIFDDLIDTGRTELKFADETPVPFFALLDKRTWEYGQDWVVWPWELSAETGIEDHIVRLLQYVGDDPTRGGLLETPGRVAKAWSFWCKGYDKNPADVLKTFEDGAEGVDEMVIVKDLPFYTHCEHHMAPFFGTATIAYLPDKKIVGLSKLSRVLDIFARRLQVQERLTCQVADALMEHLQPMGAGVVMKARHLCMESRGICQQGHSTTTSALRGIFKTDSSVRSEFLAK